MYALVDCNNFFASCERVFNPALRDKPIVVLSNNDGCVIARSNEAKKLGLKMGDPFFKVKDIIEKNGIHVFSSNYSLYGDMSNRVMKILSGFVKDVEVYSIDESFLDLTGYEEHYNLTQYGKQIVHTVSRNTGIPVSMGIAPTKTLAKVASKFAKKYKRYGGVCVIDSEEKREKALRLFDIADVWGVGRQYLKVLNYHGVKTAYDFTLKPESFVRKHMKVFGVRTWKELRGIPCYDLEQPQDKKSICTSRSFGENVTGYPTLSEAVSNFAAACARKLREQNSCAGMITVFILTNRFRTDQPQDFECRTISLPVATNASGELIAAALTVLKSSYKKGFAYKKAGCIVSAIVPANEVQLNLFDETDCVRLQRLYNIVDRVNKKNGMNMLKIAAQGYSKKWKLKNEHISKRYTTNLADIITIHCR